MQNVLDGALEVVRSAIGVLGPYWGWIAICTILAGIGEALKRNILTPDVLRSSRLARWWARTLPFHPVLAGLVIGLVPGVPLPEGISGRIEAALYYAFAGMASTWAYDVVRTIKKSRGIS